MPCAAIALDALRDLDRELARLARGHGARRLRIGEALVRMSERNWQHELGFSSLQAYALERCGRKGRWAAESCWMAQKLAVLPALRAALVGGVLGWSMVELIARRATAENEQELLQEAMSSTVRQMRRRLAESESESESEVVTESATYEDPSCVLSMTVDADDAWALECTRWLFDHLEGRKSADEFLHCILAEGMTSLIEMVPAGTMAAVQTRVNELEAQEAAWRAQREAWCEEAEARCEARLDLELGPNAEAERQMTIDEYKGPASLDAQVVAMSRELAEHDLLFGAVAERFWRADGWRRLGYASERQYARERLGISLSSVKAKRALARRSERMPAVAAALEAREIGFEAALLVTRIGTACTVDAWLERARVRTTKLLREEVEAAELSIRLCGARDQLPPSDEQLRALAATRLAAGRVLAGSTQVSGHEACAAELPGPSQMSGTDAPPPELPGPSQMSGTDAPPPELPGLSQMSGSDRTAPETFAVKARELLSQISGADRRRVLPRSEACIGSERSFGRVTLRYHVSEDTRHLWRSFEECFASVRGFLPENVTAVGFLCVTFCVIWGHALDPKVKYGPIHARDGFMCRTPVCSRRDLTAHHLKFRSAGGGDDDENLASVCSWCHLHGIHEGRIKARPPASEIRWELGRAPLMVVEGRDVIAA